MEASSHGEDACVLARLGAGTRAFLPWLPRTTPESLIDAAVRLARLGLRPVPHVAARRIASEAGTRNMLERLEAEAGVDALLLVGGETPSPAGPYASGLDLLRSGALRTSRIRKIGIGGYPEGHPVIPPAALEEALELKLRHAQHHGLEAFIVSQFCFDGTAIVSWVRRLRARGITAPIRIGISGPTNLHKLLRLGIRCGVGESLRFLRGRVGGLVRLSTNYDPTELVNTLGEELRRCAVSGPLALHVFAFGGVRATVHWLENMAGATVAN